MTRSPSIHETRARTAHAAIEALGPSPSEHAAMVVHCARAHHVATVYSTPKGAVFAAVPWAHSHGDRDRHDAAHHGGHRDEPWVDWLAQDEVGGLDDALPAGCECGARSLSRHLLVEAMASGTHRLVID